MSKMSGGVYSEELGVIDMFGYVVVNERELKGKDMLRYQSYYCGLCRSLKNRYRMLGQMTLSYDTTFLVILLTGLYEPESQEFLSRCVLHPIHKRTCITNIYSEYAADMNVMLSYYKCLDDWEDENKILKGLFSILLKGKNKQIQKQYEEKAAIVYEQLKLLHQYEKKDVRKSGIDAELLAEKDELEKALYSMDTAAGYFGEIMKTLFVYKRDEWTDTLSRLGFYFGKFLYLMDAYDDMERDQLSGSYNPVLRYYQCFEKITSQSKTIKYVAEFEERMSRMLKQMMAECARAFEHLPIIHEAEILRNIIYSGVWSRFVTVSEKRLQQTMQGEEQIRKSS